MRQRIDRRGVTSLLLSLLIISSVIAVSLGVGPGVVAAADRNGGIDNVSVYERIDEDGDGYASTIVLRMEADTHFKVKRSAALYQGASPATLVDIVQVCSGSDTEFISL